MNVTELCQECTDYPAVDVGQAVISSLESVGEAKVVNAEESEDCCVEIVNVNRVLGNIVAEIIGCTVGSASRCPSPCEPHREAAGMMVPAVVLPR